VFTDGPVRGGVRGEREWHHGQQGREGTLMLRRGSGELEPHLQVAAAPPGAPGRLISSGRTVRLREERTMQELYMIGH